MTADRSTTRTEYEVWAYRNDGSLVPTGVLDDAAFAWHRYEAHVQLGSRPIMRIRTVTTTYSEWTEAPDPAGADIPLAIPANDADAGPDMSLFDIGQDQ